jgi:hypothetical protein
MSYSVEVIRKDDQSTSTWSGGTTTQLAIYPAIAEYKARNFKWRLSSAGVEVAESTFTSLPGIYRHIMIIDGEMTIIHEGHHTTLLKPFMQDSFSGGWTTRSIGCARDFNLMLSEECKGELEAIFVKNDIYIDAMEIIPDKKCMNITQGFYSAVGCAKMIINGAVEYALNEGDLIMINYTIKEQAVDIRLEAMDSKDMVMIRAGISYL